ncbi:MAG: hypothetical protein WAV20_07805, partial [Blastocatellia bacterium]
RNVSDPLLTQVGIWEMSRGEHCRPQRQRPTADAGGHLGNVAWRSVGRNVSGPTADAGGHLGNVAWRAL